MKIDEGPNRHWLILRSMPLLNGARILLGLGYYKDAAPTVLRNVKTIDFVCPKIRV